VYSVYSMNLSSKDIIKILKNDGWYEHVQKGSHCQFKHPVKQGKVTVPRPKKDLPAGTVKSIFRQAGLEYGGKT